MPPVRKVDLLPPELKSWLEDALIASGFGDYVSITEKLNERLADEGVELRIGKSAVHAYGQEFAEFNKYQDQASKWAETWLNDNGLEEEAKRHNVLFQMITTLAFKTMQGQMAKDADEIDPRDLHFLGKMMSDIMKSSGMREKLMETERERIAEEARAAAHAEMAERLDQAQDGSDIDRAAALRAKEIMGFA